MERTVRKIWNACKKDEEFCKMVQLGDGDPDPNNISMWDRNGKVIMASYYYGWLIARHGINWRNFI